MAQVERTHASTHAAAIEAELLDAAKRYSEDVMRRDRFVATFFVKFAIRLAFIAGTDWMKMKLSEQEGGAK